ncbi:hypothetical protein QTO34_003607 [Cnephaeus nilssonii]|uniref:G-protein coupled receptors family 1 profile domain-containing protein n=1 Tax=Cnephaeus nilssonii TaxID=3371016 RepID=A0AA40HR97_CNENI|nr:hypothetical protein QTO34_003607 [Eptesicus nilssonii]
MPLMENISEVTEFILVGLTDTLEMQIPLFIIFSLIYLITLVGNLGMIMLIMLDSQLHTPMYFFLSHLSLVDCVYASAVTPKVIMGFSQEIRPYHTMHMFFFAAFATTESFLLASMAFDRHVAVCKPLHYTTTMTNTVCALLVTGPYICGLLESCIHVVFTFHLSFCHSNVVNHFFCDIPPLLALSCSNINTNETVLFTLAAFNVFFTLLVILNSYLFIFIAILRMHSTEGQKKAFSTCVSHLTTVSIFYGTIMFMYLQPNSSHSMDTDKMASIFYTMVIPMLNPLVYSLRNKEVKSAFKKITQQRKIQHFLFSFARDMFARSPVLNQSGTTEFVFRVFTAVPEFQALLFLLFLLLYLMILCGNTAIIWAVCTHSSLRTPMYFFLSNLSFIEISYTTVVVPLMLSNIFGARKPISLAGCGAQMFFFLTLGGADCFLLAIMAYDRYVAICHPLHYTLIMTQKLCIQMVGCAVGLALYLSLQLTSLIFTLPFCGRLREINHFLCDVPPVLRLACADIHVHQAVLYVVSILVLTVPFILISVSYMFITLAILRIRSAEGRRRAFSTCSSHLTVVLLQYGFCALVYLRPQSSSSVDEDRQFALIYTFVTPLLNPLIYTLRNKDVKDSLKKAISSKGTAEAL